MKHNEGHYDDVRTSWHELSLEGIKHDSLNVKCPECGKIFNANDLDSVCVVDTTSYSGYSSGFISALHTKCYVTMEIKRIEEEKLNEEDKKRLTRRSKIRTSDTP